LFRLYPYDVWVLSLKLGESFKKILPLFYKQSLSGCKPALAKKNWFFVISSNLANENRGGTA